MQPGRKHSKECLQKRRRVPRKQQKMVKLPTAGIHHAFQKKRGKGTWHDLTERKLAVSSHLYECTHPNVHIDKFISMCTLTEL